MSLVFCAGLCFASPPAAAPDPAVPSPVEAPVEAPAEGKIPPVDPDAETASAPGPTAQPESKPATPAALLAPASTGPASPATSEPEPESDPFSGMLDGGEDTELPRSHGTRPTGGSLADQGVNRDEALRRYYAALYRPRSNPARPYFAVIAGGGLLGGDKTEVNGRWGSLDVEAGASWNKVSFAMGGGISGGGIQLDAAGTTNAPFGVSGQANLGLGRLAYVRRGVLDLRLGYRASYYKVDVAPGADPSLDVGYLLPHGPELRLDVGFMVSRVREPKFFHRLGLSIGMQVIVGGGPVSLPVIASPRFGVVYAFG